MLATRSFAAALLVLLVGTTARSQNAPEISSVETPDPRQLEAKAHFERGLELVRTYANWDAALAEFLASRAVYPTRSATRNAAVAAAKLGRHAQALDLYERLILEFANTMSPDELAAARAQASASFQKIGQLEVRLSEPGVAVVVDAQQRGVTPLPDPLRVNPGTHTVRFSREGFETVELTVSVAAGQRQLIEPQLRRLASTGWLVVREAEGKILEVSIDAALVGKTPWQGALAPGTHSVLLRGHGIGTQPSTAVVVVNETATLTLRAVALDAAIAVEPKPSHATVHIDGVSVGSGPWTGRLPSGAHRIEATAPGHVPYRRDVKLAPRDRQTLTAVLDRDLSSPLWSGFLPHVYVEAVAGALVSNSFHGGADDACNCSERTRPLGFLLGARTGYALTGGLGVEVMGAYLTMSEEMTRTMTAAGEPQAPVFRSSDYKDTTKLSGPLAALSASYRALERTPITARVGLGVAFLQSRTTNAGTYRGSVTNSGDPGETHLYEQSVSIEEAPARMVTPCGLTELRFGYRFSRTVSADFGVGFLLFFPPSRLRLGTTNAGGDQFRATPLPPPRQTWSNGDPIEPGTLRLPVEEVAGPFFAVAPTLAARIDF